MAAGLSEPLYTRDILRLAASIPGQKSFTEMGDAAIVRSPTCGSRVAMRVTLDDQGRVVSLDQAVEACAFGQAAAALAGDKAVGMSSADAAKAQVEVEHWLRGDEVAGWAALAMLEPARGRRGRHGAILLPFRALAAAIAEATR